MSLAPTAERLKKVMRIALVGIRPADQVLLKGYLRVLLRLEADLEWVSANSPQVDLFMINQEFEQAASVQKLLVAHQMAAVLYVTRDDADQGYLTGNTLILPLKEIDELNQWLFSNVSFFQVNGDNKAPFSSNHSHAQPTQAINPSPVPQTLEQIMASRNQVNLKTSNQHTVTPSATINNSASLSQPENHLIDTLKTIQAREDTIFSLQQADNIIAYINPKFHRVWVIDRAINLNVDWQLLKMTAQPATVNQSATDLVQWLWERTQNTPTPPTTLVQANQRYRLTSWLKPLDDDSRHDNLKIQGLLESRDSTLEEIIQIAQVSHEVAMRSVAGLIVAGLMKPALYADLSTAATSAHTLILAPDSITPQTVLPLTGSPSISISSSPNIPTSDIVTEPNHTINAIKDDGMKGFLSKLRRKLGL